jgi:hypothetical protein
MSMWAPLDSSEQTSTSTSAGQQAVAHVYHVWPVQRAPWLGDARRYKAWAQYEIVVVLAERFE